VPPPSAPSPSRQKLGLNLAVASLSTLLALLLVEFLLRVAGYVPEESRARSRLVKGSLLFLDCYPTNPRGYFPIDLKEPGTRARYESLVGTPLAREAEEAPYVVEVRFNSKHFRGAEFPPKRKGVTRVALLGDSFTEGQGVRETDTYARVLEGLLRTGGSVEWEVLNCGRRGLDFPTLYTIFEMILEFEPDVVVYGMVLNDAEQSPKFGARYELLNDWILDRGRLGENTPLRKPGLFESRAAAFVRDRIETQRIGRETTRWYLDLYGPPNADGWQSTQSYLKNMDRRMRERGGRFLVAVWPLLVDLEGEYPFTTVHRKICRFCDSVGIPRVDLLSVLRNRPSASLWVHPVDRHPNEIAHRLVAQSLEAPLRQLAAASGERP